METFSTLLVFKVYYSTDSGFSAILLGGIMSKIKLNFAIEAKFE